MALKCRVVKKSVYSYMSIYIKGRIVYTLYCIYMLGFDAIWGF